MDTHPVSDCGLALPSSHSDPGFPGGPQPLHGTGVLEHASRRWSHPCCSASSPRHSGLPGTTPTVRETSHLAPVRSLSGPGRSLCGHPRRCSISRRLPPCPGSGALCPELNPGSAFANAGASGGESALHFAAQPCHGGERLFGSRLNQQRPSASRRRSSLPFALPSCSLRSSRRANNVTGRYPSPTMGRSIHVECQQVELWAIFLDT